MSVIGDYIHLNIDNYYKYGISKAGTPKKPSLTETYRTLRNINLQRIKTLPKNEDSVLQELKTRVAKNFGPEKANAEQAIAAHGEAKIAQDLQTFIVNNVGGQGTFLAKRVKELDISGKSINLDEALKKRDNLFRVINYYNKNPNESSPNTIIKHLNDFFIALGFTIPNDEFLLNKQEIQSGKVNIKDALKQVVMADCFSQAHKATIHGKMGERIVAFCDDTIEYKTIQEANKAIENSIIGGEGSSFHVNESFISKGVAKTYQEKYNHNLYRVSKTQDKVDVQIQVQGMPINASVKAYTPKGNKINAHLQDVSLFTNLAAAGGDFANHWLNLHSHGLSSSLLDNELETHIRYEALVAGNLLKRGVKRANTFVAIDTVNGRVYAVNTRDILEKKAVGTNFLLNPMVQNIFVAGNKKQATWEERIADIIYSLHAIKIKASLIVQLQPL